MEIFIAKLDAGIEDELLAKLFEPFGPVSKAIIARDAETLKSKGFGFVTMENAIDGQRAIEDLNGRELAGRTLVVKPSIPKDERIAPIYGTPREKPVFVNYEQDNEESDIMHKPVTKVINKTDYKKDYIGDDLVKIRFKS